MSFRRDITKCLLHHHRNTTATRIGSPPAQIHPAGSGFIRHYVTSAAAPDTASRGFFQRFLQRKLINESSTTAASSSPPMMRNMPVEEKLREICNVNSTSGGVNPRDPLRKMLERDLGRGITVDDARRLVKAAEMERVKRMVREVAEKEGKVVVEYSEFVRICVEACGGVENGREGKGVEFARMLDHSGNVIVWGNLVFLLPEQVARSMETLITRAIPTPNDPRRQQLDKMEQHKTQIDNKAHKLVKRELYCGLGFLSAQTLAFMRLTFWELSWDVMEPICFFVTSSYFALAYAFFLRTSKEPSFEGYYQHRFESKQAKLMRADGFDVLKYCSLRKLFHPKPKSTVENVNSLNYYYYNYSPVVSNNQQPTTR